MLRRLWCLSLLPLAVVMSSCGGQPLVGRGQEALRSAEEFLRVNADAEARGLQLWGLKELTIFGRDAQFGLIGAGTPRVALRPDAPDTYEVIVPHWCSGTTPQGDGVKRKCKLALTMVGKPSGFEVKEAAVVEREPLSFWRQFFAFTGWSLLGGGVIEIVGQILAAMLGKGWRVASAIARIPISWYLASVLFGSALAITVWVVLAVLGVFVVVATVANS
jgi:hypothetical protein